MSLPKRRNKDKGILYTLLAGVSGSSDYSANYSLIPLHSSKKEGFLTILIMLIMLPFCLSVFLSLFLLVVMVIFLSCYSLYNFNLRDKNNIIRSKREEKNLT